MANQIRFKRASGSDPGASDLALGEPAVRTDTGELFFKKDDGSVAKVSGGGISDGDKGDITVSSSGATFTIDNDVVTFAKMQNVSTSRLLGRTTSSSGNIEELTASTVRTLLNVEDGATADQTASEILTLIKTVDGSGSGLDADTLDGVSSASFLRSDADDSFSGTITANSDATNPIIKVQGPGPNFIQFASDSSGTVDAESINLIYRTSPNTLAFERASDATVLFSVDADDGQALFQANLDVGGGLDVTGNITVSGTVDGRDVASDGSKLDGIAASATNVTNNNQLTNGAGYITATLTNEQVQDIVGGMVSGNTESGITVTYQDGDGTLDFSVASQTDNNFTNADHSKLDGIESGATADQTASEILTLIKTVDGSGSGLDADTLDGLTSGNFLRGDAGGVSSSYQADADITFNGGAGAATIAANSDIRFSSGNWTGNSTKIQHHSSYLYIQFGSNGLIFRDPDGSDRWLIDSSGHLDPNSDSTFDIGQNDKRVRNGYFDTLYGDGSNLTGISAGATGGGSDEVFYENDQTVTTNYTITNGKNAMAAGPITINSGVTVTVGSGETLTIV